MTEPRVILITGGSRSGKSRFALEKASSFSRKVFLATALAIDSEMEKRIARHQKERDLNFRTVEEPIHLAQAIRANAPSVDGILVDCLTFWLNNLFYHSGMPEADFSESFNQEIDDFLKVIEQKPTTLILVTNEINMGVIPADPLTRRFVEKQGWLNQEVARRADEVVLMVSGIPQILKQEKSMRTKASYDYHL